MFVIDGDNKRVAVATMPGVERLSVDLVVAAAEEALSLGIPAIALFPYTDPSAATMRREAFNPDNLVCRATRAIKAPGSTSASSSTWRSIPTPATATTA